jgi:hypothetical protein
MSWSCYSSKAKTCRAILVPKADTGAGECLEAGCAAAAAGLRLTVRKPKRPPHWRPFFIRDHRKKHQVVRAKTAVPKTKQRFPREKSALSLAMATAHWHVEWLQF